MRKNFVSFCLLGIALVCFSRPVRADGFTIGNVCNTPGCATGQIDPHAPFLLDGYTVTAVTPQATYFYQNFNGSEDIRYGNGGGSLQVSQNGHTLLTGTFLPGGTEEINVGNPSFQMAFTLDYVSPVLLKTFGLADDSSGGSGTLDVSYSYLPGPNSSYMGGAELSTNFLIAPEPNYWSAMATLFVGMACIVTFKRSLIKH